MTYVTQKKLHAKKEEKLLKRFWDRPLPPQSWRTDRQTDGQTDNGLSAGGAKNSCYFFGGHVGPLHKIQGYQGHRNVMKCSPHHNWDICTTRGNKLGHSNRMFGCLGNLVMCLPPRRWRQATPQGWALKGACTKKYTYRYWVIFDFIEVLRPLFCALTLG